MLIQRKTLAREVEFEGVGLHSGVPVRCVLHPSQEGIVFRQGSESVDATPANVSDTNRRTKLGGINTIEHLMSALAALEITDVVVELDAPELPGLDGSAAGFFTSISGAGFEATGEREIPDLFTRLFMQEDGGLKLAAGKGTGHWRYEFDMGERWPFPHSFECLDVIGCYGADIASARTLVMEDEIEQAKKLGLGKGLTDQDVLILNGSRYGNAERFEDEPARHKLLDLIGDLYLSGVPVASLNVVAERSGHRANVQMAAMLAAATAA